MTDDVLASMMRGAIFGVLLIGMATLMWLNGRIAVAVEEIAQNTRVDPTGAED